MVFAALATGCTDQPDAKKSTVVKTEKPAKAEPAMVAKPTPTPAPRLAAAAEPETTQSQEERDIAAGLTEEERELLNADFSTLSADQKAARAGALKKRLMADPHWEAGSHVRKIEEDVASGKYAKDAAKNLYSNGEMPAPGVKDP